MIFLLTNSDELRHVFDAEDVYDPHLAGETSRILKEKEERECGGLHLGQTPTSDKSFDFA